ncbi:MAG: hypothetical protein KC417_00265, partial [Myxococcales bacterium]|nr:hypothetical protein [Myxococcales bacterium]
FDLVIFQNFNFGPYDMAPYLPRIRDYVRRGGAFAMVGGELSFAGGGYAETPLAEVLPVVMPPSSSSPARQFVFDRFRPVLDAAFARHPLVELRPDALGNQQAWARLSPVEGANVVDGVRPTGDVLLRHPTYPVAGGTLPLLVVAQVDRGRVLALTTDSSWRWGLTTGGATGDASAYGTFWDHALRWLAMDPLLDPTRLRVDAERLAPGESFDVQGVARDRHYIPLTEALAWTVERADTHAAVSAGTVRADARGRLTWRATAPVETGVYRITLKDPGGIALTEELFVVGAGASELANPWPNAALLRAVAERTGGKHFASLGDVPRLTDIDATRERVVGRKTMAPLATPWAFAILVALLAADWALRRRWGLR